MYKMAHTYRPLLLTLSVQINVFKLITSFLVSPIDLISIKLAAEDSSLSLVQN